MPVYLAIAYRYGWTNAHHYFAYCGPDLGKALEGAEQSWKKRNGKYGVAVLEMSENRLTEPDKRVHYFPSAMHEAFPAENNRLEAFRTLGQRIFNCIGHNKTLREAPEGNCREFVPVDIPSWVHDEALLAASMHGLVLQTGEQKKQ